MTTDPKLEAYLTALDKSLGPVSVSDRAEILTEMKSHVLEAQARDPGQSMAAILAALGEPETVANRYLMERGLKTARPPRAPIVKWLTIGFLGTFGIACASILILIWKFSPLISVNEETERMILLGGLIDVDGKGGKVKIGGANFEGGDGTAMTFEGARTLDSKSTEIHIPFTNGKFAISTASDNQFHWDCQVFGGANPGTVDEGGGKLTLSLANTIGANCDIQLPANIKSVIHGANGKIEVVKPAGAMDLAMSNGKVAIEEDQTKQYKFDLTVGNGVVSKFISSAAADAIPIKVALTNGKISRERDDNSGDEE